ncbi:hypothetical protein GCM10011356_13950 [Kangiella profundi]|nr:hypothetical protein GCM10011356_13950 [Kangiella profundi]
MVNTSASFLPCSAAEDISSAAYRLPGRAMLDKAARTAIDMTDCFMIMQTLFNEDANDNNSHYQIKSFLHCH